MKTIVVTDKFVTDLEYLANRMQAPYQLVLSMLIRKEIEGISEYQRQVCAGEFSIFEAEGERFIVPLGGIQDFTKRYPSAIPVQEKGVSGKRSQKI